MVSEQELAEMEERIFVALEWLSKRFDGPYTVLKCIENDVPRLIAEVRRLRQERETKRFMS